MQASTTHLQTMMGPHGLYQHATEQVPNLGEGYCTDDNARAVQLLTQWIATTPKSRQAQLESFLTSAWQFLVDAKRPDDTYYNFRSAAGEWLTHDISDDMYARLARAAATVARLDTNSTRQQQAHSILNTLSPILATMKHLRGQAETIITLTTISADSSITFNAQELMNQHLHHVIEAWRSNATNSWPWFEPIMTYANALLPQSLLATLSIKKDPALEEILHASTTFLIKSTIRDGIFIPIGSVGWYPKGGQPSDENQQPIEAGTMFEFLLAYNEAFPKRLAPETILAPYLWFYGANTGRQLMANVEIGASYDGLFHKGPNINYGAESMLAYLSSEYFLSIAPQNIQAHASTAKNTLRTDLTKK